MSDTPRTDAEQSRDGLPLVSVYFARRLERELAATDFHLLKANEKLAKALETLKMAEELLSDFYATSHMRSPAWIRNTIKEMEG